jgi:hypothetical protein
MAYLNPLSLYAAEAAQIICAPADFPIPWLINPGRIVVFRIFPVMMNDLDAEAGSSAKPMAACCAAIKALIILMFTSRLKASSERANGSLGGESVEALTVNYQQEFKGILKCQVRAYHYKQLHLEYPALFSFL